MNLNKGYFVIGTDTGIGKTYVSTLLYQGVKKINGEMCIRDRYSNLLYRWNK